MIAYSYDSTGLYIGSETCQRDDLQSEIDGQDRWLIPANSTTQEPPQPITGKCAIFDAATGTWSQKNDNRGTWYKIADKSSIDLMSWNSRTDGLTRAEPLGIVNEKYDAATKSWVVIPWPEMDAEIRRREYESFVESKIREKYTAGQEASVKSKMLAGDKTEFTAFMSYRTECISAGKAIYYS